MDLASKTARTQFPWARKHDFALRFGGCFLAVLLTTFLIGYYDSRGVTSCSIWVTNGLLLAILLLAPRRHWPAYIGASFVALLIASELVQSHLRINLLYCLFDLGETVMAAQLVRGRSTETPRFSERTYLLRFFCFAILAAPISTGVLLSLVCALGPDSPPAGVFLHWMVGHGLGIALVTPLCVAFLRTPFKRIVRWRAVLAFLLPFAVITIGTFVQARIPMLFLIYPLLILILLHMGMEWAAVATFLVVGIGGWYTAHGIGPFAVDSSRHPGTTSTVILQSFIAAAVFMLYSVSVVLERQKASERRLKEIVTLHNLVTENSRDLIIIADLHDHRQYVSATSIGMGGWTREELLKQGGLDLVHPDDLPIANKALHELKKGVEGALVEVRLRKTDGEYLWAEASLRLIVDPATHLPTGILNTIRDVTERKSAEQLREFHHSLIHTIHEVSLDGVLVVDTESRVVSINKRFSEIWKIPITAITESLQENGSYAHDDQLLSQVAEQVKKPEAFVARVKELFAHPEEDDQCHIDLMDGRTLERYTTSLRNDAGQLLGRVWFFRDISARMRIEQKLQEAYNAVESLAVTDGLTGLANRRHFDQYLGTEWRRSLRDHSPLSLLMIDADFFKSYNDTYGHPRGDNCLKQIAEAAQDIVSRPGDLVARFGGEEFVVVLPNTENEGAMQVAQAICQSMNARRLPHVGNPYGVVTISVGCATMVPSFGQHAVNLVEMADSALYKAKHSGRNRACNANCSEEESPQDQLPVAISAKQPENCLHTPIPQ